MLRYQQADAVATTALIDQLSPQLYRFFAAQMGNTDEASDMLQDAWLRIHRVRHTYRPGEPLLPWVYAIARRVRVDSYRKRRRIATREVTVEILPDTPERGSDSGNFRPSTSSSPILPAKPAGSAHLIEGQWTQPWRKLPALLLRAWDR